MFRLDRHIEVLLMRCDCVILPRFGAFVRHHIDAHVDSSDGLMLPPMEMVAFNAQLTHNDSLLVQSYVEAYDYSYPEALSIVEGEIHELRSTLFEQGSFEIGAVGTLIANSNGTISFEPLPAGALIPQLYGLSGIETIGNECFKESTKTVENTANIVSLNDTKSSNDVIIRLSRRTLRRVAAACVAIMLIASIPFIGKNVSTKEFKGGANLSFLYSLLPKTNSAATSTDAVETDISTAEASPSTVVVTIDEAQTNPDAEFTIVLASKIPETNALQFVQQLRQEHNISAEILPQGKAFRVITGGFDTMDAARQARQSIVADSSLADAWIARRAEL